MLGERGQRRIWPSITVAISSELIGLECLRMMDRTRIRLGSEAEEVADRRAAIRDSFEGRALATHDRELAMAARAEGFRVHGSATTR